MYFNYDLSTGLGYGDFLITPQTQASLDIRGNSQDGATATLGKLPTQFERLPPDAQTPGHFYEALTLFLRDEFLAAVPATLSPLHECVAFEFGNDIVYRDQIHLPADGAATKDPTLPPR
jgi:hypothetical protein